MWCGGCPDGFCDKPAFGTPPPSRQHWNYGAQQMQREDGRYGGRYATRVLRGWADRLREWAATGVASWVYFNNDIGGHAPRAAMRLRELVA